MIRQWLPEMDEISGFGGSYEDGCRAMVLAGIHWLDEHPESKPEFKGYKEVFGLISENNNDAMSLTKAIMNARVMMDGKEVRCGDECTGAMHHAAINHCMRYKQVGWDEYVVEMTERKKT